MLQEDRSKTGIQASLRGSSHISESLVLATNSIPDSSFLLIQTLRGSRDGSSNWTTHPHIFILSAFLSVSQKQIKIKINLLHFQNTCQSNVYNSASENFPPNQYCPCLPKGNFHYQRFFCLLLTII